jgi:hypothetical protein
MPVTVGETGMMPISHQPSVNFLNPIGTSASNIYTNPNPPIISEGPAVTAPAYVKSA